MVAAYRQYADGSLVQRPWVIAVRAPAPGLAIGPVEDPKLLGLAIPDDEVVWVGAVSCHVLWDPPALAGETPNTAHEHTVGCERSASGVTVYVGGSGFTGPAGLRSLVAFASAAWAVVSAG